MKTEVTVATAPAAPVGPPLSSSCHAPPGRAWGYFVSGFLLTAGLLCLLYARAVVELARRWWEDPSYSHGFLIPVLSIWLAVRWYRAARPSLAEPAAGLGAAEIMAGCVLHWAATVVVYPPLDFVSLVLVLRGLALLWGGRVWARGLTFPIAYLFFMFPLPARLTSAAAVWLQDIVAGLADGVLNVFWICHRQGNALHLPGLPHPLYVAEECSGLRQIVAFVALAALLGQLQTRSVWQRLLLAAAAVPVAIVANLLRVLLMAFGARLFGADWLSGWLHDVPGLLTLPLGLGLLLLASWALERVGRPGLAREADTQAAPPAENSPQISPKHLTTNDQIDQESPQ